MNKKLSPEQSGELLNILRTRFEKNMHRHKDIAWNKVQAKLEANPDKLWSLDSMEESGGEPDVVTYGQNLDEYYFFDCAPESPKGRRSLCYDLAAWEARKEHKPANNVMDVASEMGVDVLTEEQYRVLQGVGNFDTKTSSWITTPDDIRKLGGAIFGDYRYGKVFIYHNGAESYYAARGFRAILKLG